MNNKTYRMDKYGTILFVNKYTYRMWKYLRLSPGYNTVTSINILSTIQLSFIQCLVSQWCQYQILSIQKGDMVNFFFSLSPKCEYA